VSRRWRREYSKKESLASPGDSSFVEDRIVLRACGSLSGYAGGLVDAQCMYLKPA
jgi:hypothetical protein